LLLFLFLGLFLLREEAFSPALQQWSHKLPVADELLPAVSKQT
jgi:hypothetical protein